MTMTMKDFCNGLRGAAVKLASGEMDEIPLRDFDIETGLAPEDSRKVSASYIRTIMSRVPEIKAIGSVKIKRVKGHDELPDGFYITLNREPRKKVLTTEDVDGLKEKWRTKFIKQLLNTQPRITDLQGEQLTGAAIALERFAAMIEKMGEVNE